MKKIVRVLLYSTITLFVVGVTVKPAASQQSSLPSDITASLAQRDHGLSDLTFKGNMAIRSQVAPDPPEIVAQLQRSIKRSDQQEFAKSHGASSHNLSATISQDVASMAEVGKGWNVASVHEWQIARSGSQLLASGTYQDSPKVIGTYSQYYDAANVLMINNSAETAEHQPIEPSSPVIFSVSGDAIRYRYPNSGTGLSLMPEDFVMLVGANPLAMYGASWHLTKQTPDTWVLTTHVGQGDSAPFDVTLLLDRRRNAVPTDILVKGSYWNTHYMAINFQRQEGVWVCSKYRRIENSTGLVREREWSLAGVNPSAPINVSFQRSVAVADYRLLGQNLTAGEIWKKEQKNTAAVVNYPWKGTFPSIKDLRNLYGQKHPGEATPDPGKSTSALPFIGGMMCLVGGVWMFKRRGVS